MRTRRSQRTSSFDTPLQTIETERRFSGTFPLLDLDANVVDEILSMVREAGSGKGTMSVVVPISISADMLLLAPKRIDVSDDNALIRLGVTYGVLRRLGYSEETVTRCLESVDGLDL